MNKNSKCPCGSGKNFMDCCHVFINNKQAAPTAEQLMRSRYTAFTLADVDYLMKTHHSSTRPIKEKQEIFNWAKSVQWMGLTVIGTSKGNNTDKEGMVEFKALYIENGQLQAIHEKSIFRKDKAGNWFYVSGQHH
ncbi:MAG: YchJ family metal-binding protein [Carboxylicivirga sp.]|nr:YchJ family metal-binding protein [Carboxylicivirga sp.]